MRQKLPGELEITSNYRQHVGPRFQAAGVTIQFHYNQVPGIHFKVQIPEEYRSHLVKGIDDGLKLRFPEFTSSGSIWVTGVHVHPIDSCATAFYRVGRLAVDQASSLDDLRHES